VFKLKKSHEGSWPEWKCFRNMSATAAKLAINDIRNYFLPDLVVVYGNQLL